MASIKMDHFVLDLSNPLFSIPLGLQSQDQVTFTWNRRQWASQALPLAYFHSPTICHRMVARGLKKWILPEEMVLYYYINDFNFWWYILPVSSSCIIQVYLKSQWWEVNSDQIQGPGQSVPWAWFGWVKQKWCQRQSLIKYKPSQSLNQ